MKSVNLKDTSPTLQSFLVEKLSTGAERILRETDRTGFLSATQARTSSEAVTELLIRSMLIAKLEYGGDGYVLSRVGKQYLNHNIRT